MHSLQDTISVGWREGEREGEKERDTWEVPDVTAGSLCLPGSGAFSWSGVAVGRLRGAALGDRMGGRCVVLPHLGCFAGM